MQQLAEFITGLSCYNHVVEHCSRNKQGSAACRSAFANILFMHEAKVLDCIIKTFHELGWKTNGLIFDGTPVKDRPDHDFAAAMCEVELKVHMTTGFKIKLAEKPMFGMECQSIEELLLKL
jgi:hypothetical protein